MEKNTISISHPWWWQMKFPRKRQRGTFSNKNSYGLTSATPTLWDVRQHYVTLCEHYVKKSFLPVYWKRLSASKGFTHEEILANAMLFILAGHETTASTLQFFWYLICMNPAVQNQIYEEIQQKEKFSYEDIRDFKVRRDISQIPIGNLVFMHHFRCQIWWSKIFSKIPIISELALNPANI